MASPKQLLYAALSALALTGPVKAGCGEEAVARAGIAAVVPLHAVETLSTSPGQTLRLSIEVTPMVVSDDHPYSLIVSAVGQNSEPEEIGIVSPFPSLTAGETRRLEILFEPSQLQSDPASIQVGLVPVIVGDDLGSSAVTIESARIEPLPE